MRFKIFNTVLKNMGVIVPIILLFILFTGSLFSLGGNRQEIAGWLVLGPADIPEVEANLLKGEPAVLNFTHIPIADLQPMEGETVRWSKEQVLKWRALTHLNFSSGAAGIVYAAAYLETDRWLQAKLLVEKGEENLPVAVFLDGQAVETGQSGHNISAGLDLLNAKHILVLKIILPKGKEVKLQTLLETEEPFREDKISLSLNPVRRINEADILNTKNVREIMVSPNGKLAAIFLGQTQKESGANDRCLEILDASSGKTVFSTPDLGKVNGFVWLKDSLGFSYTITEKEKTSLYTYNIYDHSGACLLEGLADFSSYWWADDNSFIIYTRQHQEKKEGGYKYIKEIPDRAKYSGTRFSMYIYFPAGKVTHQIAGQEDNFYSVLISPDCKKALLLKDEPDNKNRPYRKNVVYLFDVAAQKSEPLLESNWAYPETWAPDSKRILFLGGPSSFNGIGKNLEKGNIPNDYDQQAYIYDLKNREEVAAISKGFNPAIDSASWKADLDHIYFRVTDEANVNIYRYSVSKKSYKKLDTKVDVVGTIGFSGKRNSAVFWGSSANMPHKLYKINLAGGFASLLKDYNKVSFSRVKIGKVLPWNFKSSEGKTIIGRIHYPVDFDKNQKYPCIVYYYGGTSPVERSFGGRYPFNWYTAQGYIVYVLQPSGAVGFGQDFSAVHVNDWGEKTSQEILTGVKELLKAHSYIDPQALGAMGASYGGFMTQYLATCTDMFAAFISHAGISALSGYWGVGDWGYTYSGIATADSFPWNRKDIYVGHSPLFKADRISNPLLLLHGDADNNVPPGESYQMFAALKLLNKEVALVTFDNLSHLILEYKKRLHWMRTIIAWFDKYLKKQPQHWNRLYPGK